MASTAPNADSAVTSLVLGILSLVLCGLFTGIPAMILGRRAIKQIDSSGGRVKGRGLATAGFVTGLAGTVLYLLTLALLMALGASGVLGYSPVRVRCASEADVPLSQTSHLHLLAVLARRIGQAIHKPPRHSVHEVHLEARARVDWRGLVQPVRLVGVLVGPASKHHMLDRPTPDLVTLADSIPGQAPLGRAHPGLISDPHIGI